MREVAQAAGAGGAGIANEPLRLALKSDEDYAQVCRLASICRKPSDIRRHVFAYLSQHGYKPRDYRKASFLELLLPHLVNYAGKRTPRTMMASV